MVQWLREERREGKDGKREGGVCVWERQTEACNGLTHHLLLYVRYVLLSEHTNEKALAGTYTSILLGIQGSYFEPHVGTLYVTCTTHATHIQINTGQRRGSTELANLLLPFGSSHFQTPKSIHFTPPPPHQPQSTFAVILLFNNHYILWFRPWYGVEFKGWKACCFLFSSSILSLLSVCRSLSDANSTLLICDPARKILLTAQQSSEERVTQHSYQCFKYFR